MNPSILQELMTAYGPNAPDTSSNGLAPDGVQTANGANNDSAVTSNGAVYLGPDAMNSGNHLVVTPQGSTVSLPHSMLTPELQAQADNPPTSEKHTGLLGNIVNGIVGAPVVSGGPSPQVLAQERASQTSLPPNAPAVVAADQADTDRTRKIVNTIAGAPVITSPNAAPTGPAPDALKAAQDAQNQRMAAVQPQQVQVQSQPRPSAPRPGFNQSQEAANAGQIQLGQKELAQSDIGQAAENLAQSNELGTKEEEENKRYVQQNEQDRQKLIDSNQQTVKMANHLAEYADPSSAANQAYYAQLQSTLPNTLEKVFSGLSLLPGVFGQSFRAANVISTSINNHTPQSTAMVQEMHTQMLQAVKQASDLYNTSFTQAKDLGQNDATAHTTALQNMKDAFDNRMKGITYKYGGKGAEAKFLMDSGKTSTEALAAYTKRKTDEAGAGKDWATARNQNAEAAQKEMTMGDERNGLAFLGSQNLPFEQLPPAVQASINRYAVAHKLQVPGVGIATRPPSDEEFSQRASLEAVEKARQDLDKYAAEPTPANQASAQSATALMKAELPKALGSAARVNEGLLATFDKVAPENPASIGSWLKGQVLGSGWKAQSAALKQNMDNIRNISDSSLGVKRYRSVPVGPASPPRTLKKGVGG